MNEIRTRRLTVGMIEKANRTIDPVFLGSPQFVCEPLGAALGCRVLLKLETLNPVRCFKGRGSDFLVAELKDRKHIYCASAGNFGQAMAYSARRRGIELTVYAASGANPYKIDRMRAMGAEVVLFTDDFERAKEEARRAAEASGACFVEDSVDLETLAGAGTIGLELLDAPDAIDFVLVSLGNGALLSGVATVLKQRKPDIEIIAVQAAGAPAMVESLRSGEIVSYEKTDTIADGISVRLPIPLTLEDMDGLVDGEILVGDDTIIEAMKLLFHQAGIVAEPSAAVGIAAILENREMFEGKSAGSIICGSNLTVDQMGAWF